ncbi:MAG: glycosyltransferase family A protein [Hellea sp.]
MTRPARKHQADPQWGAPADARKTRPVQDWSQGVSIIVPTYKRPDGIRIALNSLMGQSAGARAVEIIIADNDPLGSAEAFVKTFAKTALTEIIYRHVPEPGVSNARNGALDAARGRFIAFLDDDMDALPGWLEELVKASLKYKAAITFGPARAVMPNKDDPLNPYMAPFFSRVADAPEGYIEKCLGTGGCLLDLSLCQMPSPAFDPIHNETGGEDDALFHHLQENGAKVAWAIKAESYEIVPASRATPAYMWKRNFAFGQGPTQEQADKGAAGTIGIAKWMSIGALQLCIYGPLYLGLKLLGRPKYIHFHNRTAQALGKICWWSSFTQKLYGVNATTGAINGANAS